MAKSKYPDIDYSALCNDLLASRKATQYTRNERTKGVKQYVGQHFSEEGSREPVPINLLASFAQIIGQKLIAKNPQFMLTTELKPMKPAVAVTQQYGNEEIERMNLEETLGRAAFDALWVVGVVKVALAEPDDSAREAWNLKSGEVFAEVIDFDDLYYDTNASSFDHVKFIGHKYRASLDTIKDSEHYSKARKNLTAATPTMYNEDGDEKVSSIGATTYTSQGDTFDPQVTLVEVYIPRHRIICTFVANSQGTPELCDNGEPLRIQPWIGPEWGPYIPLGLGPPIPGSPLTAAPYQNLTDLAALVNELYTKLFDQACRQKDIGLVPVSATADAENIRITRDGHLCAVANTEAVKPLKLGGPDQINTIFAAQMADRFSKQGGNLELQGGLAPQSGTAKQDSMLNENASAVMSDMQSKMIGFAAKVIKSLVWFWWHEPLHVMSVFHTPDPGLPSIGIPRKVAPQQRPRANWRDVKLQVDPFSMQHQTPTQRAKEMIEIVNLFGPMMPMFQQQGVNLDVQYTVRKLAEYRNNPDYGQMFTIGEPPQQEPQGGGQPEQPGMPANTTRSYVRESRSAGTQGANENEMMTAMNKASQQGDQQ